MNHRERTIRRIANEVLDEVDASRHPIDPEWIATKKGLRLDVRSGFPAGVYGALYCDGGTFGVVISSGCHGRGHRNFTIAHELGHFHIDGHAEAMFTGGVTQVPSQGGHFRNRRDPQEREADWFASELLMPERFAAPLIDPMQPNLDNLAALASRFEVSLSCAAIRYAELTPQAVAVIVSREAEVEWIALSSRFRDHKWSWKAWRRTSVPPQTATLRLGRDATGVLSGRGEMGGFPSFRLVR